METNSQIGAHVSAAGGLEKALERLVAIGGNCLQVFAGNPRSWRSVSFPDKTADDFKRQRELLKVGQSYFHAPYLINLASPEAVGDWSERLLIAELKAASKLGLSGSIVHLGSYKRASGVERRRQQLLLLERIKRILNQTPSDTFFIIENAGTRKIGLSLEEIGEIIDAVDNKRLKVCLDTCHLHAAGFDLGSQAKLNKFLKLFDNLIGLANLELFHLNDSKDPLGALRDRHENIGDGFIGRRVFSLILHHPKTKNLPFITEVPGLAGLGPDRENLRRLRELAA
jgi:deoxyribonuclease-4